MSNILVFLFFVTALCVSNSNGYTVSKGLTHMKIIGGNDAKLGEFPWIVSLQKINKTVEHFCGGVIYSENFIITAAHCVSRRSKMNTTMFVRAGSLQEIRSGSIRRVVDVIVNPTKDVDLAMLEIWPPLKFHSHIQPVSLNNEDLNPGTMLDVAGWGYANKTTTSGLFNLQKVQVPYITNKVCKEWLNWAVSENEMCAGYEDGGKDSCAGDSGGPLTYKGRLYGIVIAGFGCGKPKLPGVYARVSKFNDWIRETANNGLQAGVYNLKTVGE